jgi:hypothetical protein
LEAGPFDHACAYISRGWSPVPVPHKTKGPVIPGWQDLRLDEETAAEFFNGQQLNIGVLTGTASNGLVDVDLDCTEALTLADAYLPRTKAVFGRPSKPRSHRLYRLTGEPAVRCEKYVDPDDQAVLLELRGDRHQTVFPGSTHPSGEAVAWDSDGTPAEGSEEGLMAACSRLAAAAMLMKAAPEKGRHDLLLLLAGALVRRMGAEPTLRFLTPLAKALLTDRARAAASELRRMVEGAAEKLEKGEKLPGRTKLTEALGKARAAKLCEWLGIERELPADDRQRVDIRLSLDRWNQCLAQCAQLLTGVVYMRGVKPMVLARAAEAGGSALTDTDEPAVAIHGVRHRPGALLLIEATGGRLAWHLDERARFWRWGRREQDWVLTTCPKDDVAASLVENALDLPFLPCSGIVRVPLLIDGKLVCENGHHASTGLILDLAGPAPGIPGCIPGSGQGHGPTSPTAAPAAFPRLPRAGRYQPHGAGRGHPDGGAAPLRPGRTHDPDRRQCAGLRQGQAGPGVGCPRQRRRPGHRHRGPRPG